MKFPVVCNKFQFGLLIFLFSSSSILISSCKDISNSKTPALKTVSKITDDAGVEVSFDSIPKRIVSLAPNITEALFAIGADSLIAGVTNFCDYPPEAKLKTKTGSYLSPDYETMVSLKPDLIIINVENISNPTYQALKNTGAKLFVSNAKDIKGILKMLNDLGKITGKETESEKLVENILKEKHNYENENKPDEKEKSFITVSVNPLMTANGGTFISEVAALAGFENIYGNQKVEYPLISYEDVMSKNPSVIILPIDTANQNILIKFTGEISEKLNAANAVKNKRIILVDENIMFRPGPRVMEAVEILRKKKNRQTN